MGAESNLSFPGNAPLLSVKSAWISANAGSGKTYSLINRVMQLLISGADPNKILCITFTNSAAEEMKARLFERLAEWTTMEDKVLLDQLRNLLKIDFDNDDLKKSTLRRARQLFAEVLESQSKMRISTIHSFCEYILRHFSFETEIPFDFKIIDELERKAIIELTLSDLAKEKNQIFRFINSIITPASDAAITELAMDLIQEKERLYKDDFDLYFGADFSKEIRNFSDVESLKKALKTISREDLKSLVLAFSYGGRESQRYSKIINDGLNSKNPDLFQYLEEVFLTKEKRVRQVNRFPEKVVKDMFPGCIQLIAEITNQILAIRAKRQTKELYIRTKELKKFGLLVQKKFEKKKLQKNVLDYNDLLDKTLQLLSQEGMLPWVNFKIDSSINHLLVDESQDISPLQWDIINKIASQFFEDQSIVMDTKSIFTVGDDKQSIYSFQGAVPNTFSQTKSVYSKKLSKLGLELECLELGESFRSSSVILNFVNEIFNEPAFLGVENFNLHHAKKSIPGRIEIWPNIEKKSKVNSSEDWEQIFFRDEIQTVDISLAKNLANEISQIVEVGVVPDESTENKCFRKVEPRDILILFRSRGPLFYNVIAELKRAQLPVSGADRIKLSDDIAVNDLISLLKFLDNPLDDLSLAEALKSPLFSLDEKTLFKLAYNRSGSLWDSCLDLFQHNTATIELKSLLSKVDYLTVYEILEFVLVSLHGMEKFIARLGLEVKEILEEFLAYTLDYEEAKVSSLSHFIHWISLNDIEIKRQIENDHNNIRVLTVHSSKGHESPIVILPDTNSHSLNRKKSKIIKSKNSIFFRQDKYEASDTISKIEELNEEEQKLEENRLLYVALTRPKYWLIICGHGSPNERSWYQRSALAHECLSKKMAKLNYSYNSNKAILSLNWYEGPAHVNEKLQKVKISAEEEIDLMPIKPSSFQKKKFAPSSLGEDFHFFGTSDAKATGDYTRDSSLEMGTFIHRLLGSLVKKEAAEREGAALNLARVNFPSLNDKQVSLAVKEALTVINSNKAKRFFSGKARFEVPIVGYISGIGKLSGKIDCLLVLDKIVEIVDFKTDQIPPTAEVEVTLNYIIQLAAYANLIKRSFPEHCIHTYLLWTKNNSLMQITKDFRDICLSNLIKNQPQ